MANNGIYPRTSPYFQTGVFDKQFLDVMTNRPIPRDPSDAEFVVTVQYEFRPDLLAQDLYDDPKLWWVFAQRNPNQLGPDPYFNFKSGIKIYLPRMDTLRRVLGI
jgi:hypothetical protein|tara:strand:+ start:812 stop:1126 length:315 start_codon:yes stop_codon:yes gene_type:complete